jgi:hypothetical protein
MLITDRSRLIDRTPEKFQKISLPNKNGASVINTEKYNQ